MSLVLYSNNGRVGAPYILDRAQVREYMDRVESGFKVLDASIENRMKRTRDIISSNGSGKMSAGCVNTAYASTDGHLPCSYTNSFASLKAEWRQFYESMQDFNLFGPTVWSAWNTTEGYETRLNASKKVYVEKYDGAIENWPVIPQSQVESEHPEKPLLASVFGDSPYIPLAIISVVAITAYIMLKPKSSNTIVIAEPKIQTKTNHK